jgi:MFS family permease
MIADLYPPRRLALALGIFATGSSIGAALAFIAGGAVIGELQKMGRIVLPLIGVVEPWQMVFLLTGLPGLFIALLMFTVPEPVRTGRAAGLAKAAGFGEFLLMHWQYFTCHFLGYGLVAVLAYGAAAWMPAMLMRTYGLSVSNVGLIMGAVNIFFGMPGFIVGGWIVDRWYAKGQADAHLRYFVIVSVIGAGFAFVAFQVATTLWAMLAAYVVAHFLQPFTGPAVAHLQMVTPTEYRGRVSALFVMVFNLMGMCLGPPSVAFLTDYLFHDPQQVKSSLAVMYVGVALLAALVFALGLGPARRMVEGTRPTVLPSLATDAMEQANI